MLMWNAVSVLFFSEKYSDSGWLFFICSILALANKLLLRYVLVDNYGFRFL